MIALLLALALAIGGCAITAGYAGKNPGYFECYGKGTITVTGSTAIGAGVGGGQSGNFTVMGDCSDTGFIYSQGMPPPPKLPPEMLPPALKGAR